MLALNARNLQGGMVPLSSFVTAEWKQGPVQVVRYNSYESIRIGGNAAPGYTTGDAMAEMERLAAQLPPGYGFEWNGLSYQERQAGNQAPILMGLSLLVVFLVLAALYESWAIPLSVMLVVPLGMLGAVALVSALGMSNDVYFQVGMVTVIGLAAKNAILIVEFAKDQYARGMGLYEAAVEAARLRFRPILMTSLAFILGVVPLAMATGAGAASQRAVGLACWAACLPPRLRRDVRADLLRGGAGPVQDQAPPAGRRTEGVRGRTGRQEGRRGFRRATTRSTPWWPGGQGMKALMYKQTALSAFVAVALAGCSLAPDYKRPDAPVSGNWPDQPKVQYGAYAKPTSLGTQPAASVEPQAGTPAADIGWREFFRDPRLQRLIELSLANNRDLRVAVQRVEEARAQYGVQRGAQWPSIGAGIQASASTCPPTCGRRALARSAAATRPASA